jgi:hypothetical protein
MSSAWEVSDMTIDSDIQTLPSLGKAEIGRGPRHPEKPDPDYGRCLREYLERFPYLRDYPDYIDFLERYGGARVFSPEETRTDLDFLYATIYGAGEWEFADEAPAGATREGFFEFAVVEMQFNRPYANGIPPGSELVACFAFDATGTRPKQVYAEVHPADEPSKPFRPFCSSFTEWLRLFVQARGWLIPFRSEQEFVPAQSK